MKIRSIIQIQENDHGIACYHQGELLGELAYTPVTNKMIAHYSDGTIEHTDETRWLVGCLAALNIDKAEALKHVKRWMDEAHRNYCKWMNDELEDRYDDVTLVVLVDSSEVAA